jgi:hypothetical protein
LLLFQARVLLFQTRLLLLQALLLLLSTSLILLFLLLLQLRLFLSQTCLLFPCTSQLLMYVLHILIRRLLRILFLDHVGGDLQPGTSLRVRPLETRFDLRTRPLELRFFRPFDAEVRLDTSVGLVLESFMIKIVTIFLLRLDDHLSRPLLLDHLEPLLAFLL